MSKQTTIERVRAHIEKAADASEGCDFDAEEIKALLSHLKAAAHLKMLLLSLVRAMEAEIDTRRCRDSSLHVLNLARKEVP